MMTTAIGDDWWDAFCDGRHRGYASAVHSETDTPRSMFNNPASHLRMMDAADRGAAEFAAEAGWLAGYAEGQVRER